MAHEDDSRHVIVVRKRPLWIWLLGIPWLCGILFFVQTAIASAHEYERQAATVSWGLVVVLLILGLILWFRHGQRSADDD